MYTDLRAKLITRLNKSPSIQNTHPNNPELTLFNDQQAIRTNLMNMLSPYASQMSMTPLQIGTKFTTNHYQPTRCSN